MLDAMAARLEAGSKIPIAVQLYSVRGDCKANFDDALAKVAAMGFKGVEFAGYYKRNATQLRQLLDDHGLVCCGTHTGLDTVTGDALKGTIEFNRILGNKYLIVPGMSASSRQGWLDLARRFNEIADKVKPEGMLVGYHAHGGDFKKYDGETAWDIFFGSTKPEVVMQLDTSNCRDGGADPVAVLKKYPGRARTIHLKASGGGAEAVIGEDKVEWKEVFAFCEGPGKTEWYIVEHESGKDPVDAVKRCYAALKKMGKV